MAGRPLPPKPWERAGAAGSSSSGPSPFTPSSGAAASTTDVVASAGVAGDTGGLLAGMEGDDPGRAMPSRPWESQQSTGYGGATSPYNSGALGSSGYYGSTANRHGSYGSGGMYGSSAYGGGMYGSSGMYGSRYGSTYGGYGGYGSSGYGSSGYGMGGSGYGGAYGGYGSGYGGYGGMGMMGGYGGMGAGGMMGGMGSMMMPPGADPNDPNCPGPPRAPTFWVSCLKGIHALMTTFGRLSVLVDENTHAFHFFITAMLQLFDRAGVLYGELARFILRLFGWRPRPSAQQKKLAAAAAAAKQQSPQHQTVQGVSKGAHGQPAAAASRPMPAFSVHERSFPGARGGMAGDGAAWDNLWPGSS